MFNDKEKNMLKVGILTHPMQSNYGGVLQAIALFLYLERKGCDVSIINRVPNYSFLKRVGIYVLSRLPFQDVKGLRSVYKQAKLNEVLISSITRRTSPARNKAELAAISDREGFDVVVVGSDQVWRMDYIDDGHFANYFLDFVGDDVRKISYAASFGLDYWQAPRKTLEVSNYLKRFHAVSVREDSGVDICKRIFGRADALMVLDPTMLFEESFYTETFNLSSLDKAKPVVGYILDPCLEKTIFLNGFTSRIEGGGVNIGGSTGAVSIVEWLSFFKNSKLVITDSFHGVVFSIVFKKDFYALVNDKRGSARFVSLLRSLDLEKRIVRDTENFDFEHALGDPINYLDVDYKLNKLRADSAHFLEVALS